MENVENTIDLCIEMRIKHLIDIKECKNQKEAVAYIENCLWDYREVKPSFLRKLKRIEKKGNFIEVKDLAKHFNIKPEDGSSKI